jgi:hypothetical protein
MKITINLTNHEANHLKINHTFYNACNDVASIMTKVQNEVRKIFSKEAKNGRRS